MVYSNQDPSNIHPLYLANMLLNVFPSIKIFPPFLVLCLLFPEELELFLTEYFLPSGLGWLCLTVVFNVSSGLRFSWKRGVTWELGSFFWQADIRSGVSHWDTWMSFFSWSWDGGWHVVSISFHGRSRCCGSTPGRQSLNGSLPFLKRSVPVACNEELWE